MEQGVVIHAEVTLLGRWWLGVVGPLDRQYCVEVQVWTTPERQLVGRAGGLVGWQDISQPMRDPHTIYPGQ